jgi:hypothetical protein
MIDKLIRAIFRWDRLRESIFDEVMLYQSVTKAMVDRDREHPTNLTWADEENGLWKGWTYNSSTKRYYFDDIGNESLMGLWEDQWNKEDSIVSEIKE